MNKKTNPVEQQSKSPK